jgi:hypothetical protein
VITARFPAAGTDSIDVTESPSRESGNTNDSHNFFNKMSGKPAEPEASFGLTLFTYLNTSLSPNPLLSSETSGGTSSINT